MCTHNELRIISDQMLKAYQSVYGASIAKVVFYGSYARGDNHTDSDIDNEGVEISARTNMNWERR